MGPQRGGRLNRNEKKLNEQKGSGKIWLKIDGLFKTFCVGSTVLNCQDVLNLIFLWTLNQSNGDCCSGLRCDYCASF